MKNQGTAIIDWLSFTWEGWSDCNVDKMVRLWLREWMREPLAGESGNGLFGFEHSVTFYSFDSALEEVPVAILAWGGERQRGRCYLSINGTGCSLIKDWQCVQRIAESIKARITRVDVAVDDVQGEMIRLDEMPAWYEGGKFNAGGRRPTYKVEGDWFTDLGAGRTFYVGRRQNGKYCRVYEKGKQLGNRESPWSRFEVEIHNVDRVVPYDVLTKSSEYFVGCYPICETLVDVGAERIKTLRAEHEISLDRLRGYCRIAYGKLIHVLRIQAQHEPGYDELKLIDELCVQGLPRRLAKTALHMLKTAPPAGAPPQGVNHGNV